MFEKEKVAALQPPMAGQKLVGGDTYDKGPSPSSAWYSAANRSMMNEEIDFFSISAKVEIIFQAL